MEPRGARTDVAYVALWIAIASVRQEEVIDPREMEKAGRTILDLGHAEDVGLLSYGSGYEVEILRESVRLRPTDRRGTRQPHSRAAVELDENGRLLVESNVRGLQERNGRSSGLEIVEGDVAVQMWLRDYLEHLYRAFSGRVKSLSLDDLERAGDVVDVPDA